MFKRCLSMVKKVLFMRIMTMANCSYNQCFKRVVFWFSFFFGLGRTGSRRSGPPGYAEFCGAVGSFGFVTCALFFHCFLSLGFSLCGCCFFCGPTLDSVGLDWAGLGTMCLGCSAAVSPSVTARTKRLKLVSLVLGFERVAAKVALRLVFGVGLRCMGPAVFAWSVSFTVQVWTLLSAPSA